MVEIDFRWEEEELVQAAQSGPPATWDGSDVQLIWFEMPVRIRVNGVDMLAQGDEPYSAIPIAGLAIFGLPEVEGLQDGGEGGIIIPGGGGIGMRRTGDFDQITCTLTRSTTEVSHREFLDAWRRFAHQVADRLLGAFPGILEHPGLRDYFRAALREE